MTRKEVPVGSIMCQTGGKHECFQIMADNDWVWNE